MDDLTTQVCQPGAKRLTDDELRELIGKVPGWKVVTAKGPVSRQWKFGAFMDAIRFVNRVAELAEAQDHHPDLLIRHAKVRAELSTHDAGGLTLNDFILAARISVIAESLDGQDA